jgi:hypothetical protein
MPENHGMVEGCWRLLHLILGEFSALDIGISWSTGEKFADLSLSLSAL